jgi:hypothetical protein
MQAHYWEKSKYARGGITVFGVSLPNKRFQQLPNLSG